MDVKVEFHVRFLFVLLLSLSLRHAIRAETMNSTRNIRDGEVIVSDDGSFKLGFFSPRNSTYRYFGIWFGDVEEQTAVWVANREDPVKDFSGIFRIWEDGNLVVLDGNSNIHWSSNATFTTNTSVFELLKTGNLVLRNGSESDSDDNILWQSFDHPTDNFLADMKFGLNLMTGENQLLTDWRSDNNPAPGKFSLGFDPSGIAQIIIWNGSTTYWRSGIWNGQTFSGVPEMTSFHLYNFNIIKDNDNGKLYSIYSSVNVSAPSSFVLSSSGKLERSYWRNETNSWDIVWSQPNNECQLYGKCGPNGSCNWKKSPDICSCLKGFEPNSAEEWKLGNWSGGCVRKRALECEDGSTTDGFLKLSNVKLPDKSILEVAQETNECEDMCRKNCSCIAFAYERGLGCLTWRDSLQDIQIFDEGGQDLYLRLSKSDLKGSKSKRKLIFIISVVASVVILTLLFVIFTCMMRMIRRKKGAWELWKEDRMLELLDKPLQSSHVENEVHRCIQVGLLCVQDNAADRPTMDSVVFMLGNESAVIPAPQKPTFSLTRTPRESDVCGSSSGHCSANGVTMSVVMGR
ncbi:hypothetical protein Pint_04397 [Pistacia integerrima]|uniref:Uncharacterized protein n=1 Tax=Pistacia integerrima TaxID=434235 RepID=A0ACC0Z571_9ROSI|nr:hypothetical protein Pint_04397 [Pistacia integerrima]